ncbi:hypothetical protein B7463_g4599, partial [Scytalidium lignicola]
MGQTWSQIKPPAPVFTEDDCPDLTGKVLMVTGGYSGVGFELCQILYQHNGIVYIAGRSGSKGREAIESIKKKYPKSAGRLEFLLLDLDDLTTLKKSAKTFLAKEDRLDVLWNNAGVMMPPAGSKTKQGYELQIGTNCLAPYLWTELLLPIMRKTVLTAPANAVRIIFLGSFMTELYTPKGVINFKDINHEKGGKRPEIYAQSKIGNIYLATEYAKRNEGDGILYISLNPGNLKSGLQRHATLMESIQNKLILHRTVLGAYTELVGGLSPNLTVETNAGDYLIPWGRVAVLKKEIAEGVKSKADGGTGLAEKFFDWCKLETQKYL